MDGYTVTCPSAAVEKIYDASLILTYRMQGLTYEDIAIRWTV